MVRIHIKDSIISKRQRQYHWNKRHRSKPEELVNFDTKIRLKNQEQCVLNLYSKGIFSI